MARFTTRITHSARSLGISPIIFLSGVAKGGGPALLTRSLARPGLDCGVRTQAVPLVPLLLTECASRGVVD